MVDKVMQLDQIVLGWLASARQQILNELQQPLHIKEKTSQRDLVTNVDQLIEQFYIQQIKVLMPHAKVMSEEGFGDQVSDMQGDVWFIDPIDGTLNFVEQQTEFATMLAYYRDGQPIAAWIMDVTANRVLHGGPGYGVYDNQRLIELGPDKALNEGLMVLSGARLLSNQPAYTAIAKEALSYRVYGSAGIAYMHVLLGQAIGYISVMRPWDFVPGVTLAKTLGLSVSDVDGAPLDMLLSGAVVVSTPRAHTEIMRIEKQVNSPK